MYRFEVLDMVNPGGFVRHTVQWTLLFIVVLIAMLFLPWQQTVKGTGMLTALDPTHRQYDLRAPVDGVIETFYVRENQFINAGDKLFAMHDMDAGYGKKMETIHRAGLEQTKSIESEMETLEEQQKMLRQFYQDKHDILQSRIRQTQARIDAMKERKKALEHQQEIEKRHYERSQRLYRDGIESQRDLEQKRYVLLKTEAEHSKIKAELHNKMSDLAILTKKQEQTQKEFQLKRNELENRLYQTQNRRDKTEQNNQRNALTVDRYKSRLITAKSDGYVVRIYQNDRNKLIKRGEKILSFVPRVEDRAIRLKISAINMPLIKEGLKTRIMFYGWPSLHISGWPRITHGTYGGIIRSIEPSSYEKGFYYALVVEDPDDQPWPPFPKLKYGTEATLWVRLSTVPIWYELWRMLASQPPRMVTPHTEDRP